MYAVLHGSVDSVRHLLRTGADPNLRNEAGAFPLIWSYADLEKSRLLLDNGADVNARTNEGRTALIAAAGQQSNMELVKLLLERGANPSAKSPVGQGYATPLSEAAGAGDEKMIRLLLEKGADLKGAGPLPLANASRAGCKPCLDLLIEKSDKPMLTAAALVMSPPFGNARDLHLMLDKGANPKVFDPKGNSTLILAAGSDLTRPETIQKLIEAGVDLNTKSAEGRSALDLALRRGSTPIIDLLKRAGAIAGVEPVTVASPAPASSMTAAIERSIPLLQKSDQLFTKRSLCISCHHNSLTAMSVSAARKVRVPVSEEIARSQIKEAANVIESWRERVMQGLGMPGESGTMSYILFGLAAEKYPGNEGTEAMASYIASRQLPDGRWRAFGHRPPIASSDYEVTALALKVLQVYGRDPAKTDTAVRRAAEWLRNSQPDSLQDHTFQLLGIVWAGFKPDHLAVKSFAKELLSKQRPDGGWSQLPSLASDAYATGQVLFALRKSGAIDANHSAFKRGTEFLMRTQLPDGSWYVRSRVVTLQPYFESGFPHGHDQWISAAATNWATLALITAVQPMPNRVARRE